MGNIINEHYSAYIKGKYIEENARIILYILYNCEENNSDGILLFLDFEKAFDLIEFNFTYFLKLEKRITLNKTYQIG